MTQRESALMVGIVGVKEPRRCEQKPVQVGRLKMSPSRGWEECVQCETELKCWPLLSNVKAKQIVDIFRFPLKQSESLSAAGLYSASGLASFSILFSASRLLPFLFSLIIKHDPS